jgi:carbonic anhydrase/acetyltransferase-like protein (isoleucine patch superfamily)
MGMLRNLVASGVAAKVIRELQKPQNQAKIKKFVRDYQAKNKKGGPGGRAY